jgi:hypothetical protein
MTFEHLLEVVKCSPEVIAELLLEYQTTYGEIQRIYDDLYGDRQRYRYTM